MPNPDPTLCPLPAPWDGQVEIVLHLAPPDALAGAQTIDYGSFASVAGVVHASMVIPSGLTYRGTAVFELVGDLDSLPSTAISIVGPSPVAPAAARPVVAQLSLTG